LKNKEMIRFIDLVTILSDKVNLINIRLEKLELENK